MSLNTNQVKSFFERPFYLDHGRPVIQVRLLIINEMLKNVSFNRLLDLGCGDGSLSTPFLNRIKELTLVDFAERMISVARNNVPAELNSKVTFICTAIDEFSSTEKYDVVFCVGVLAHVPSLEDAVAKVASSIKRDGVAVLEFTPNPNPLGKLLFPYYWLRRKMSGNQTGYSTNKIPLSTLLEMTSKNGLQLKVLKRHYFPLPTMAWWPNQWIYHYSLFIMKNAMASKFGTEHIMLFIKTEF